MKHVSIGKYAVPSWILVVALASVCVGVFALCIALTFTIPFEVKEPIEVLYYPSQLSLYPGDTLYFNVTVRNNALQTYGAFLDFSLGNTTYENSYLTFSNETYFVVSGVQNLTAWVTVSPEAPPTNAVLTVNLFRTVPIIRSLTITNVEFLGSETIIRVTLKNTGSVSVTLATAYINEVVRGTAPSLPQTVSPDNWLTLDIASPWVSGNGYNIKLVDSMANVVAQYLAIAPA